MTTPQSGDIDKVVESRNKRRRNDASGSRGRVRGSGRFWRDSSARLTSEAAQPRLLHHNLPPDKLAPTRHHLLGQSFPRRLVLVSGIQHVDILPGCTEFTWCQMLVNSTHQMNPVIQGLILVERAARVDLSRATPLAGQALIGRFRQRSPPTSAPYIASCLPQFQVKESLQSRSSK